MFNNGILHDLKTIPQKFSEGSIKIRQIDIK